MAGASDKARFYLERYVPELREYEQKGIFSRDEIAAIAAKRNDFEHTLNARGSRPTDYARYATYEMNLDALRKKRSKRLGIKSTAFAGQRTVFFVLDRGTKKFPGDMALWMQYIQFCQREKANKKLAKIFTNVLRLKPREWGLWVLAAKHYAESQGDMSTARSYMQRGLRFCKDESRLWVEYMRLEMLYLAKLAARRKILGLDERAKEAQTAVDEGGEDMITLPSVTAADFQVDGEEQQLDADTEAILQKLPSTPALAGAISIAIFDAAMKQFKHQVEVAERLFEVVETFDQTPASRKILQHVLEHMQTNMAGSPEAIICEARLSMFGIDTDNAEFPLALGEALVTVKSGMDGAGTRTRSATAGKALVMLTPHLQKKDELDEDIVKVLEFTVQRYLRLLHSDDSSHAAKRSTLEAIFQRLYEEGRGSQAALLQEYYAPLASQ